MIAAYALESNPRSRGSCPFVRDYLIRQKQEHLRNHSHRFGNTSREKFLWFPRAPIGGTSLGLSGTVRAFCVSDTSSQTRVVLNCIHEHNRDSNREVR